MVTVTITGPFSCTAKESCKFHIISDVSLIVSDNSYLSFENIVNAQMCSSSINCGLCDLKNGLDVTVEMASLPCAHSSPPLLPNCGDSVTIDVFAYIVDNNTGLPHQSNVISFLLTNPCNDLTLGVPGSGCNSNTSCGLFSMSGPTGLMVTAASFSFKNLANGASINVVAPLPSSPYDISKGLSINVTFNDLLALVPTLFSQVCNAGTGLTVEALATAGDGTHTSPTLQVEVVFFPAAGACFSTQINGFAANTAQFFNCIGVDGVINVQGTLVHCGSILGVGVCQQLNPNTDPQHPIVHIGLTDPATGIFYEYEGTPSQVAVPNFTGAFTVSSRTDVLALIPTSGSKTFKITAVFDGDQENSPSSPATIDVTIKGEQADPCFLGTVLAKATYPTTIPKGELIHEMIMAHTVKAIGSLTDTAEKIITTTHDTIVNNSSNPIDITVYRGPDVALFEFEGFGLITVPTFTIVAHSWGSPIAVAVLILIIIAALIILGIIIYFILQVARDIISLPGGAGALTAAAIAVTVIAVAGVGALLYFSRQPRIRRFLA